MTARTRIRGCGALPPSDGEWRGLCRSSRADMVAVL
jgi:hypothetical protein